MELTKTCYYSVAVVLLLAILGVQADFEYQCDTSDYIYSAFPVRSCGRLLPEFIIQHCNTEPLVAAYNDPPPSREGGSSSSLLSDTMTKDFSYPGHKL